MTGGIPRIGDVQYRCTFTGRGKTRSRHVFPEATSAREAAQLAFEQYPGEWFVRVSAYVDLQPVDESLMFHRQEFDL